MRRVRSSGLDAVVLHDGEALEEYATRMLGVLLASTHVLELVGALIVPVDVPSERWTPRLARATAFFLGRLTDPQEKLEVQRLVLAVLIPFLQSGLACLRSSDPSSVPPAGVNGTGAREPAIVTGTGAA